MKTIMGISSLLVLLLIVGALVFATNEYAADDPAKSSGAGDGGATGPNISEDILVTETEYDRADREVNFEFGDDVRWDSPEVSITDSDGKEFAISVNSYEPDSINIKVKKLTYGETYDYTISGISKGDGTSEPVTITGRFKAIDS